MDRGKYIWFKRWAESTGLKFLPWSSSEKFLYRPKTKLPKIEWRSLGK